MTEGQDFPPPGALPPPPGAPPAYPDPNGGPPPGSSPWAPLQQSAVPLGAVHRPGAVPLRPLDLGAMYDGAFRIIRYNPKATIGAALLVCSAFMVVPVLVTSAMSALLGTAFDPSDAHPTVNTGDAISLASLAFGVYGAQLGLVFVSGMIAHVTRAAAVGRRLTLGQAWAATHGKRWRLIGLALLLGLGTFAVAAILVGVVVIVSVLTDDVVATVLLAIVLAIGYLIGLVVFWTRVICLSSAALMLEPIGVFGAIGRAVALTRGQFWRVFGIGLLTAVIATVAGGVLGAPITIVGEIAAALSPAHALLILSIMYALSTVASSAFTAPFKSAVATLQYLDQRIRKEGYDVELMREAGLLGS